MLNRERDEYKINGMLLRTKDEELELIKFFDHLTLNQDIYSHYVSGTLRIQDDVDIIARANINGGETFILSYETDYEFKWELLVTDIEILSIENDKKIIDIHFKDKSFPFFRTHIARGFSGKISDFVSTLMLEQGYTCDAHQTLWKVDYIIPNWSVDRAITFFEKRAVSDKKGSCYRLFQTNGKDTDFAFKSMQDSFSIEPDLFFLPLTQTQGVEVDASLKTYKDLEIINIMDYNESVINGGHGSNLIVFDPFNKSYNNVKKLAEYNTYKTTEDKIKIFKYRHDNDVTGIKYHTIDFVQQFAIIDDSFERFVIKITVPGSKKNDLGKTCDITILSDERDKNNAKKQSDYYTGKYIITGIEHILNNKFMQRLTLQRLRK